MRKTNFIKIFKGFDSNTAIMWGNHSCSYSVLIQSIKTCSSFLESSKIEIGSVVSIEGDFSPKSISLLFSLIEHKCIIVPINRNSKSKKEDLLYNVNIEYDSSYFSPRSLNKTFILNIKSKF